MVNMAYFEEVLNEARAFATRATGRALGRCGTNVENRRRNAFLAASQRPIGTASGLFYHFKAVFARSRPEACRSCAHSFVATTPVAGDVEADHQGASKLRVVLKASFWHRLSLQKAVIWPPFRMVGLGKRSNCVRTTA